MSILWSRLALRERFDFAWRSIFKPSSDAPFALLCVRPVVLSTFDWAFRPGAPLHGLLRELADRRVDILCSSSWNYDNPVMAERFFRIDHRVRKNPNHRLTYLAATSSEVERFTRLGLSAIHVNHDAFVDEQLYRPLPNQSVKYDAVYDANLRPFKRHELAADISRLALITYILDGNLDAEYWASVEELFSRAHVFNGAVHSSEFHFLNPVEINQALNQCAVGLCLSREEGAMFASIQYLLAGLPVVTTPSLGGRDIFYHPDYVETVDPTPQAVAAGVERMRSCSVSADEIRNRTLERVDPHRERLIAHVEGIIAEQGPPRSFRHEWQEVFCNKLSDWNDDPTRQILEKVR
jgi:glycosyltransferase involved in cell wall biosynthesis